MINEETNREIDKVMYDELVNTAKNAQDSFFEMRDQLMLNFDREKVADMTAPLKNKLFDLNGKIKRFGERMRRRKRK